MKRLLAGSFVLVALGVGGITFPMATAEAKPMTATERTKTIRAAQRAVPNARLTYVHHEKEHRSGTSCVEMIRGRYEYDVDVNRSFKVVEIDREYND